MKINNIPDEQLESQLKYLKLLSKQYPSISSASAEIINLEAILSLPKGTEHFLSDLHGEYEPFVHVLKNGSGVIKRKIEELFGNIVSEAERKKLATIVYYPEQKLDLLVKEEEDLEDFYRITIHRLIELCRYASSKYTRSKVRKFLPDDFKYIIEELLHPDESSTHKDGYYKSIIETIIEIDRSREFIIALSKVIQKLVVDRLHIVGDVYDRGPRPDIIMDTLINHHNVDVQWGNHDILWMGAASGQKVCIANAIRISARYANLDIVEDIYGINLLPLATFAMEAYKDDPCTEFMPKVGEGEVSTKEKSLIAKMHKAISMIQFKLEAEVINNNPDFDMKHRLLLDKVDYEAGTINLKGKVYKLIKIGTLWNDLSWSSVSSEGGVAFPAGKKPVSLMKRVIAMHPNNKGIILDFFAGSASTAHSVMELNSEDLGLRTFICITSSENNICQEKAYPRIKNVILGYGKKMGLTRNNLRYYKTKFVSRDKSPKNLRNLMALSTDMLCIHNDTYIEKSFAGKNINNKIARYFESNDGTKRMLVIYRAEAIQALVELMKEEFKNAESKENGKLMVYVFSPNGYAYDDEFEDVADYISLCAMPDAVQNAYRRVLPKKRQAQLLEDVAEETDSEARTVEESDLFQNQTYTMAASEIKDNREGGDE